MNTTTPGYWRNETSGVLRPAVKRYLDGEQLSATDIAVLSAYLRQWVTKGDFHGPAIRTLRYAADTITCREHINVWTDLALDAGIDPW